MSQSVITVISGEAELDLSDAPALCDPLVEDGLIESWRPSVSVQGVTLILRSDTTSMERRELIDMIKAQGLRIIEDD
jgi:hypothetical protein